MTHIKDFTWLLQLTAIKLMSLYFILLVMMRQIKPLLLEDYTKFFERDQYFINKNCFIKLFEFTHQLHVNSTDVSNVLTIQTPIFQY